MTCPCACHDNKLKEPYEHDAECCENMNGYMTNHYPSNEEIEKELKEIVRGSATDNPYTIKKVTDFMTQTRLSDLDAIIEEVDNLENPYMKTKNYAEAEGAEAMRFGILSYLKSLKENKV